MHKINRYTGRIYAGKRAFSRGALPGGFTKEGLLTYAKFHWEENVDGGGRSRRRRNRIASSDEEDDETDMLLTDLFSHKISPECSGWLDSHEDPSGALGRAYFGSPRFIPERIVMSPFYKHTRLLDSFKEQEQFLAWKVVSKAPLELICEWNFGSTKGLTMLAFDPTLRRIYNGNCVNGLFGVFEAFVPQHEQYAKYLLKGMGDTLEKEVLSIKQP